MKLINEHMYSHGCANISDILNSPVHELTGSLPAIYLAVLFCKVNVFLLLGELLPKIIPYFIIEYFLKYLCDF